MTTSLASGHLHLDAYDCESCGYNSNDLEWDFDGREIRIHASIGCYHSYNGVVETSSDVADFLSDFLRRYPEASAGLHSLAAELDGLLASA